MKWTRTRIAALALALAALAALALPSIAAARPATPPATPVCTSVASTAAVNNGMAVWVTCASGAMVLVSSPDGSEPATGPAHIERADGYDILVDSAGEQWVVIREAVRR